VFYPRPGAGLGSIICDSFERDRMLLPFSLQVIGWKEAEMGENEVVDSGCPLRLSPGFLPVLRYGWRPLTACISLPEASTMLWGLF
jgi:hypothetical protein